MLIWQIVAVASVLSSALVFLYSQKIIYKLQRSGYRLAEFKRLIEKNDYIFTLITGSAGVAVVALMQSLMPGNAFKEAIILSVYFVAAVLAVLPEVLRQKKTKAVYTPRLIRLAAVHCILTAFITAFVLCAFGALFPEVSLAGVCIPLALAYPCLISAHYIILPYEQKRNSTFVKSAQNLLADKSRLIKIGITGSYGKTSVKNMLGTILSQKYKVVQTPKSFNTPMGIARSVTENLKPDDEVFIAEMGARYTGDIKELCNIVRPDYAIITGVGNQHLETFLSPENILNEKLKLYRALSPEGFCVFNGTCENLSSAIQSLKKVARYEVVCAKEKGGTKGSRGAVWYEQLKSTVSGSSFMLCFDDGEKISCDTKLLGKHNVVNMCMCACLARRLKLGLEEIKKGIESIEQIPHRLQIINTNPSMTVIDDSYNASVESAAAAAEVMKSFKDSYRVVVTPGIVELGQMQEQANRDFGRELAAACDYCLLTGQNAEALKAGLLEGGADSNNVLICPDLKTCVASIPESGKHRIVLFCNDLPE